MKKTFQILLLGVGVVFVVMIVSSFALMYDRTHGMTSCASEQLSIMRRNLNQLIAAGKDIPGSLEEYRHLVEKKHMEKGWQPPTDYWFECQSAKKPYVWKPKGIQTDDGRRVIAMCPLRSHGHILGFAWGLLQNGNTFCFVRVYGDGDVEIDSNDCRQQKKLSSSTPSHNFFSPHSPSASLLGGLFCHF